MKGLISSFICSHSLARAAIRRVAADLREVNKLALRPTTDRRATAKRGSPSYSTEQRETVRSGLRIPARMIVHAHPRRQESRSVTRTRFQPSCRPAKCPLQLGRMSTAPLSHGVQSSLFSARDLAYARRKEHFPQSASCSHSVGACFCSVSKLNAPICTPCRESRVPVHPAHSADSPRSSQTPQGGAYVSRVHTCTPAWEVPNGHIAVHTGGRTPRHDGSDDHTVGVGSHGGEQNEKGQRTEAIERPRGDGVLRRAAGDAAARSAHPRPDHRPRPPAASGVPVRGCAQAIGGGRGLNE